MDVITATLSDKIAEEKKIKNLKLSESRKNKKRMNQGNQNVEISSKENFHRIAEAGVYVGPGVDLEKSSQVDKAHAEEIAEKNKTLRGELNEMKNHVNSTNQNAESTIKDVDLKVESMLQDSAVFDESSTEIVEEKKSAEEKRRRRRKLKIKSENKVEVPIVEQQDELLVSSVVGSAVELGGPSQGDRVLSDAVKEHSHNKTKKRKRKSKSKSISNNELEPMNTENKCLEISVDKSCITENELGFKDVNLIVKPVVQESAEVEEVPTEIVKEKPNPERKKRRKKKSEALYKDGKPILDEGDNCLEISIDSKSCIAAVESGINGVGSTVEPMPEESLKVDEVSTEISKESKIPEGKRERKKKLKASNEDGKAVLDEEVKCPKVSVDGTLPQELPRVAGIDKTQKKPGEKRRRKKKSETLNKDGKAILDEEDKSMKISVDQESCVAAAESDINGVGSTVEPMLQEPSKVEEVSTEISKENKISAGKRKRKKKSKASNEDGKAILDEEVKCLKVCVDGPLRQELPKVEEASTGIAKTQKNPEGKRRRKRKSKDRDTDEKVILGEEDKCLKISVDRETCVAAAELGINGVGSTVEPMLQESSKVEEVSTEISKENQISEVKRKRKKKSKARNEDEKAILNEEVRCLKVSVDGPLSQELPKVEEVSTGIAKTQKNPEEKRRRKKKSKDKDTDEKVILREDKCLKISADRQSCVAAAESTIKDVDLKVESMLQNYAVFDGPSTEIGEEKKSAEGKRRRRRKLKIKSENKVEVPILEQPDELLVSSVDGLAVKSMLRGPSQEDRAPNDTIENKMTSFKDELVPASSVDGECCTKTEMGTLQGVCSSSTCPSDKDSSLFSNGLVDLSNGLNHLPQRAVRTCSRKILLILDINGLLADIVMPPPKERKSDINMLGRAIFKRPYCDDFLNFCFDTFDVGIWSSRTKRVIDKVVDYLLGKRRSELLFCWDMSHTTPSKFKTLENRYKPLVCKSLRNLWEKRDPALPWNKGDYTESNTLLIDDSPYKALLNPMHTAIFPYSFTYMDLHDKALGPGGEIRVYLENLAKTDDVRKYVEQHPFGQPAITEKSSSWDFYSKVVSSLYRF